MKRGRVWPRTGRGSFLRPPSPPPFDAMRMERRIRSAKSWVFLRKRVHDAVDGAFGVVRSVRRRSWSRTRGSETRVPSVEASNERCDPTSERHVTKEREARRTRCVRSFPSENGAEVPMEKDAQKVPVCHTHKATRRPCVSPASPKK